MKVVLSDKAVSDLSFWLSNLFDKSQKAAETLEINFFHILSVIEKFPKIGTKKHKIGKVQVFSFPVDPLEIRYCVRDKMVEVLRVHHQKEDR